MKNVEKNPEQDRTRIEALQLLFDPDLTMGEITPSVLRIWLEFLANRNRQRVLSQGLTLNFKDRAEELKTAGRELLAGSTGTPGLVERIYSAKSNTLSKDEISDRLRQMLQNIN